MTKSLFDVFRESMLANPNGSRAEASDRFLSEMSSDPSYLRMLARAYFDRMAASWAVNRSSDGGHVFARSGDLQAEADARRASTERTASALAKLKAKMRDVILLDLVLPNGKTLRNSTGAECAKAGGFFSEVAKTIKPTQVVDRHLSEADLQNIRARFYQANKDKAA